MISFIVPIYNAEKYLNACVQSLLAQTVPEIEIILMDDGSTDGSGAIARAWADKDARVQLFRQTHAGQSVARNTGMKYAHGEFIAFVDADDTLQPDWSERHLNAIEGADYVQSGYRRIVNGVAGPCKLPRFRYQFISPCMRLYRRETVRGLQFAKGFIYEDVLFSVDMWLSGASGRTIRYAGYNYTYNPDSTTSRPHPEARQRVIRTLRQKAKGASAKGKMLIYYTILRLHTHFLLQ